MVNSSNEVVEWGVVGAGMQEWWIKIIRGMGWEWDPRSDWKRDINLSEGIIAILISPELLWTNWKIFYDLLMRNVSTFYLKKYKWCIFLVVRAQRTWNITTDDTTQASIAKRVLLQKFWNWDIGIAEFVLSL